MSAPFLHGVETLIINKGPRQVLVVKSAVIGLIGIAPSGPINTPTLVNGDADAAQFGSPVPGFNIPQSLNQIFEQGAGTVVVVNVFDPVTHTSNVSLEAQTPTAGKLKLSFAPIGAVLVFNNDGTTPYAGVLGTDYTIDAYGNFTALTSTVVNGTPLKFTYKKLNTAAITNSLLIGAIDGTTGARTGMKCWALSRNLFGFNPKILIAPGYSSINAIAAELRAQNTAFRSIALLDAPAGTTVANAISGRGISGTINFNTSDKRAVLLFPMLKAYDIASDTYIDSPYSAFMAGIIANTDQELGFWYSPSNKEIQGIVGTERPITAALNDATADANILNAVGITTIFNTFGTGIRTWGNRNASYPTNTDLDSFIGTIRTTDVVHESLENSVLAHMDMPINQALIDTIREEGNSFVRVLIGRGALTVGSRIEFPKEDVNTPTDIAAGHLTYDLVQAVPPPLERVTYRSFIDIGLLASLK